MVKAERRRARLANQWAQGEGLYSAFDVEELEYDTLLELEAEFGPADPHHDIGVKDMVVRDCNSWSPPTRALRPRVSLTEQ